MQNLKRDFWLYVRDFGGPATLEDVFSQWASKKKVSYSVIESLWKDINDEITSLFRNKYADNVTVEITGNADTVKEMLTNKSIEGPLESKKDELEKKEEEKSEKNEKEEDKDTLIDMLAEEEEEGSEETPVNITEVPPLAGETAAPPPGPSPTVGPAPTGLPTPPLGGGVGGPPNV